MPGEYKYDKRSERLARQYIVALRLTNQLLDSGLLERKVRLTVDNLDEIRRPLLIKMAADLREAQRHAKRFNVDQHDELRIIEAYFDELAIRGGEWEYADLQNDFSHWRDVIVRSLSDDDY